MQRKLGILFVTLISVGLLDITLADFSDDIRGTMQSLVYSYNQLDNKLERHEHRERALGELLKKALQALQKGQKNLEPLNGIFSRLDERVSQIETMLITQEEKYNIQTEKLNKALEHVFKWMRENNECYKRPPTPIVAPAALVTSSPTLPELIKQHEKLNQEISQQLNKLSINVEKLLDTSKDTIKQTELIVQNFPSTAEMLTKIENKLISHITEKPTPAPELEFEKRSFEKFEEIKASIVKSCTFPPTFNEGLTNSDKAFIQDLTKETFNALKLDTMSISNKALATTISRITETEGNIGANTSQILKGVTGQMDILQNFYNQMNSSYSKLSDALEMFNRFNNVLMANSEHVLDTQRKVEFSTLQTVQKINYLLDKQWAEITNMLKKRFDALDENVINSQFEIMQNLSSTIEMEISHVWRQISIMNIEITDNKDLLTLMQGRNEVFVNGTFSSMDTMGTKVEEIKGRMLDMDSNLNYLLGKLSIMSQEFSSIKNGLAESLEQLRNTFHTMQEKIPSQDPRPQNIAKNEYETEVNLLHKRHTV